jgi:anti-sigma factor RsiW
LDQAQPSGSRFPPRPRPAASQGRQPAPVAALVYRRREHLIDLFVWPMEQDHETAPKALTRQGYHLLHWTQSGMTYWAVSNLNEGELKEFARLVQDGAP